MLKTASFSNFTIVPSENWKFSPGLNVIVGENGLGKSHVLKVIYSVLKAQNEEAKPFRNGSSVAPFNKAKLAERIANELVENLRPDQLGRLVRRKQGRAKAKVGLLFTEKAMDVRFSFATNSKTNVELTRKPGKAPSEPPVFIPTRELVTFCPWFLSLYDNQHVPFEKSWRDTVLLLGAPAVRGRREEKVKQIIAPIEEAMNGRVEVDKTGRFFLNITQGRGKGKMEAPLVAEGLRKFVMLARLVSTGVLLERGYLFWDEPETNLNPKLIKVLAKVLVSLANQGIQIFIATHSLFLLREISIITDTNGDSSQSRYFSIVASDDDKVSKLEQGDTCDELETLVFLDEELTQSDRYMEAQDDG